MTTEATDKSTGLTRRSVVTAAAWAAPVIALAVAAPAHASSLPPKPNKYKEVWDVCLNVKFSKLNKGKCGKDTQGEVRVYPANTPGFALRNVRSDQQIRVSSYSLTLIFPFAVTWEKPRNGWSITTRSEGTYVLTRPDTDVNATTGIVLPTLRGAINMPNARKSGYLKDGKHLTGTIIRAQAVVALFYTLLGNSGSETGSPIRYDSAKEWSIRA